MRQIEFQSVTVNVEKLWGCEYLYKVLFSTL